jgi:enoyl-[acyl-carrier protein] reductase II
MKTRLTELLGIKYPIIQGAMAWTSDANLAIAVANAGGAGVIAMGGRTVEWVRDEIRKVKKATDKPFGVNIMLMDKNVEAIIDLVCEEKVPFVTLGAGNPTPYFDRLHAAGVKAIPVVPSVKLANRVEEKGADAMVIEGMEAGGHIGTLSTMALMTNVLYTKHKIPVIVAGGIADGRGLAAALVMGADGVQVGSRFIVTEECASNPKTKEAIIKAADTDSVVTGYLMGTAVRCLKNSFTKEYLQKEAAGVSSEELTKLAVGTNRRAAVEGDCENGAVLVGESLTVLDKIEPCAVVIERMVSEAKEAIKNANKF